jgi:hypothetical protein
MADTSSATKARAAGDDVEMPRTRASCPDEAGRARATAINASFGATLCGGTSRSCASRSRTPATTRSAALGEPGGALDPHVGRRRGGRVHGGDRAGDAIARFLEHGVLDAPLGHLGPELALERFEVSHVLGKVIEHGAIEGPHAPVVVLQRLFDAQSELGLEQRRQTCGRAPQHACRDGRVMDVAERDV